MKITIYNTTNLLQYEHSRLSDNEIHVWTIHWRDALDFWNKHQNVLSETEKEKALKFRMIDDQNRYRAGKIMTRLLLQTYLSESCVEFLADTNGKPYHKDILGKKSVGFNISHSGEWLFAVFSHEKEIGVDVEEIKNIPNYHDLAKEFFSKEEYEEIQNTTDPTLFYQYWSAKEAYVKALGIGILQGLDFFSVKDFIIKDFKNPSNSFTLYPIKTPGYAAWIAFIS